MSDSLSKSASSYPRYHQRLEISSKKSHFVSNKERRNRSWPQEKPSVWIDGRRPWDIEDPTNDPSCSYDTAKALLPSSHPVNFFSLTLDDLKSLLQKMGHSSFRAQQLYKWIYDKKIEEPHEMSNLSKEFRQQIPQIFDFKLPQLKYRSKSADGTEKFLFELRDGNTIETALIPADDRLTICLSSEVGCNMACRFCYTGKQKLKRRLTTDEIVGQFYKVEQLIAPRRITNIVFMGMGEPLDNPEAVFKTIEILHSSFGRQFSRKKITVSTCGIVPEMWRVAASHTLLAVSLNGYDNQSRTQIMPINQKYPIEMLLQECKKYVEFTKEKVTFEYVLLKGYTDQLDHAQKLYQLTRSIPCKINIIPFNEHPNSGFERPDESQIAKFQNYLISLGAHVLRRRTMGRDIEAACGQLTSRKPHLQQSPAS